MTTIKHISRGELSLLTVDNALATATISLQGGQLLAWQPKTQAQPVIWLSPRAILAPGKAIRGGIPVCWPWFGAHPLDAAQPAHGYARISPWAVVSNQTAADGATEILMCLNLSDADRLRWPQPLALSLRLRIGETLQLDLSTHNEGTQSCLVSEALHSYFQIGDISAVRVVGLEHGRYEDKLAPGLRRRQEGAISFAGEVDRVYVDTHAACCIEDDAWRRRIQIDKSGSASTVVWSPWADKAGKMADLGADGWRQMLCVETANALDNALSLAPGVSHTLSMRCAVQPL